VKKEVDAYLARVDAERRSQQVPDDETADELRLRAPEIVPVDR
jgi:glycerol-3-phosphate dehydrogenase